MHGPTPAHLMLTAQVMTSNAHSSTGLELMTNLISLTVQLATAGTLQSAQLRANGDLSTRTTLEVLNSATTLNSNVPVPVRMQLLKWLFPLLLLLPLLSSLWFEIDTY